MAALRYQAAVEAIQTAAHEDAALANKEPQYKKLKEQMIEVDSLLTQLREAMNMFKLPTKSSDGPDGYLCKARAMHLYGQINQRIRATKALIRTKFDLVKANNINLCDPNALPQVEMSLCVLHDIFKIVNKDLILVDYITNKDLTKEQTNTLI